MELSDSAKNLLSIFDNPIILIGLVGWFVLSTFSAWVASQKGRSVFEGFVVGMMFGPLGVLVEAMLPSKVRPQSSGKDGGSFLRDL